MRRRYRSFRRPWELVAILLAIDLDKVAREAIGHSYDVVRADFGITLIILVVSFILAQVFAPKPQLEDARPAGLGDFSFPTAAEDRKIPIVFGTVMLDGPNVVWYGDQKQVAIEEEVATGMFSSEDVIVGFRYKLGVQFALCHGNAELLRIRVGEKDLWTGNEAAETTIVVDEPKFFGGDTVGQGGIAFTASWYPGTNPQSVNAYLTAHQIAGVGPDATPSYPGTAHLVVERGYFGNSPNIKPWAFEVRRIPNGLGLTNPKARLNGGNDCNPANAAYELLVDEQWGMRQNVADIDIPSFLAAADTFFDESNGFSMVIDATMTGRQLLDEIERQTDCRIDMDPTTGKWSVKLIRNDYDIDTVPELTAANIVKLEEFTVGTWRETVNQVRALFFDRDSNYQQKPAVAMDHANAALQGDLSLLTGKAVGTEIKLPGVKNADLADSIVWREHRLLSHPLIRAKVIADRTLWNVVVGDVVAFSATVAGTTYTKLPMRISTISHGLETRDVTVELTQDVFQTAEGIMGPPQPSMWVQPTDDLEPFDDVLVMEAPYGLLARDPKNGSLIQDRIWCGAAEKGNEVGFKILARVSPDPYVQTGTVYGLLVKATLTGALVRGAAVSASFTITCGSAVDKALVLAEWNSGFTPSEVGASLRHMLLIDNEFVLVTTMASGTGDSIICTGVMRGVLDSVQSDHADGTDAWLMFINGGLTSAAQPAGSTVDVKLLPFSATDEVLEAAVTAESVAMSNRLRQPIPPGRVILNGVVDDTTSVSLEGTGSGDTTGVALTLRRRDYRGMDEFAALQTDAATLFADFPAANTTEYQVAVHNDPAGANTPLFTVAYDDGPDFVLLRNEILKATDGVLPTTLGIVVTTRHVYETVTRTARYTLPWAFTVSTALSGRFNFGALDQNETSAVYTATQNGTYSFTIATALATGDVEYRLNLVGLWLPLITTGNTSGSIPGILVSDTIEIRHTSSTAGTLTLLLMDAPSTGQDGYAVLFKV